MSTSRARSLAVGVELKRRRERAGLSGVDVARSLDWSQTKVTNMERGNRTISQYDAARFLAFCRDSPSNSARLLDLFTEHDGYWVQPHTSELLDPSDNGNGVQRTGIGDELLALSALECAADRIVVVELSAIPALLQTEEYTEALLRKCAVFSEQEIRARVQARRARQLRLRDSATRRFKFFIHEDALGFNVDPQVMHDQMLHLAFQASESQPEVSIQIIPRAGSAHAALTGPFSIMEYEKQQPIVHIDQGAVSLFLDTPAAIQHYDAVLASLNSAVATEKESHSSLLTYAYEYDRSTCPHVRNLPGQGA